MLVEPGREIENDLLPRLLLCGLHQISFPPGKQMKGVTYGNTEERHRIGNQF
nr:MAG TPA: hypothetical protein [Caudoviricetes sp.]